MLKNIPKILSPELLKVLCEMGHGDTLVIGDGNFPAASVARANGAKLIRADGFGVPVLLRAILTLFPLDMHVERPVGLMEPAIPVEVPIWDEYFKIISEFDPRGGDAARKIERFAYYEEAKRAYAVIASGESAIYANIILQKGVIADAE